MIANLRCKCGREGVHDYPDDEGCPYNRFYSELVPCADCGRVKERYWFCMEYSGVHYHDKEKEAARRTTKKAPQQKEELDFNDTQG